MREREREAQRERWLERKKAQRVLGREKKKNRPLLREGGRDTKGGREKQIKEERKRVMEAKERYRGNERVKKKQLNEK